MMNTRKKPFIYTALFSAIASTSVISTDTINASVSDDFSKCATAAIDSQQISTKKISLDLPSDLANLMDHNASPKIRELVLTITNPQTGESIGKFSCRLTRNGEVTAIRHLSRA